MPSPYKTCRCTAPPPANPMEPLDLAAALSPSSAPTVCARCSRELLPSPAESVLDAGNAVVAMVKALTAIPPDLFSYVRSISVEAGDNGSGGNRVTMRVEFGP